MLTFLQGIDQYISLLINQQIANSVLDWICPWLRTKELWVPLYILVLFLLFYKLGSKAWGIVLLVLVLVFTTDQLSSELIKNLVQRPRPCNDEIFSKLIVLRVHCGTGYSFTSTHASNHFALSFILIQIFQKFFLFPSKHVRIIFFSWAGMISFSQVYVGVHYFFDIVTGALLGWSIASMYWELYSRLFPKMLKL
jgi:membrane-associated phospholipid phosphatase